MSTSTCPNGHASEASDYCDMCGAPIDQSQETDAGNPSANAASAASNAGAASAASNASASSAASAASSAGSAGSVPVTSGSTSVPQPCPNCALANTADALFCEGCGYDFTTGTMPRPAAPADPDLGATVAQQTIPDPLSPLSPSTPPSSAPAVPVEWVAEVWVDPDWYADQDSDVPCPSPGLPVTVPLRTRSLLIGRRSRSRNIHPEIECPSDVGVSRRQAQLTTDGQRWWVEDLQSSNGTYVGAASEPLPSDPLPPGRRRELAQDDRIYVGAWTCIVVRRATPEEQHEA